MIHFRVVTRLAAWLVGSFLAALVLTGGRAAAQDYPNHPVRFIVCFAAGGPTDTVGRLVGQYLGEYLHQQFVIENRVGAGGNIGTQAALNAAADGYTVLFVSPNHFINATLYEHLPYDFIRDSVPIGGTMKLTNVLEVNNDVPIKSVAEYIAYAKANPGKMNFGHGGVGTSPHMSGELLKSMAGINIVQVPYRGTAPAVTDLLGGQLQSVIDNLPGSIGHIRAGKVRALGVTAPKRIEFLPDVPAIAETVPGYEADVYYGMGAPKGTPPAVIKTLNEALNAVLKDEKLIKRINELGGEPMPMTPEEFGKLVQSQTDKWAKVIKSAGLKTIQ